MAELWHAILGGALAGLVIATLVGPVFFTLLQTSLEKGFLMGVMFAMGIIMSDASYFLLAYFGISQFGASAHVHSIMGIGGGGFLIVFGLRLALRKSKLNKEATHITTKNSLLKSMAKGFLINALNPGVLLYWIVVVSAASAKFESDSKKIFAFFITTMLVVFSTDIMKSYLAYRLKKVITVHFMTWLNRISGSILVLAGGKLLIEAVIPYLHFA